MTKQELDNVLELHERWLAGEADGVKANLQGADLQGATLRDANLQGADLQGADLQGADLRDANLQGADLQGADLRYANLRYANLRDADLRYANLFGTCLSKSHHSNQRYFCKLCPPNRRGGRIVYRAAYSQHCGHIQYQPGNTYVAPNLSFSVETACHPGVYAGSLEYMKTNYRGVPLVRCYVRDGDWVIADKGCIRCARLRVLSYVDSVKKEEQR